MPDAPNDRVRGRVRSCERPRAVELPASAQRDALGFWRECLTRKHGGVAENPPEQVFDDEHRTESDRASGSEHSHRPTSGRSLAPHKDCAEHSIGKQR